MNSNTYEQIDQVQFGNERRILVSELSGRSKIFEVATKQNIEENKKITKVVIDEHNFASEKKYETNYQEEVKKSKKLHKNIMLVLVSNYCPWCRKFEQRVLLKKEVNAIIQKNYIPLIINREKEPFPKEFDTGFTPIVHFIDYKTQKSYKNVIGYNNKDEFTYILKTDTLTK